MQDAGANFVAFEAEDFDAPLTVLTDPTATTPFPPIVLTPITDANASGGEAVNAAPTPGGFSRNEVGDDAYLGYQITFNEGGEYRFYLRYASRAGGTDSFFAPTAFGVDPTSGSFVETSPPQTGGNSVYQYEELADADGEFLDFAVADGGETVEFYLKPRENDFRFDRIVLSQDTGLSDAELAALPNSSGVIPEPASALAGAIALGLLGLRRR